MGQLGSSGMKVRRILQSLDHRLHAALEPLVFRRVRHVVVRGRAPKRRRQGDSHSQSGRSPAFPASAAPTVRGQFQRLGLASGDLAKV
jgi:hypothetical protein